MADEIKGQELNVEATDAGQKTRRAFVRTAAQVAVTVPAVALLLNSQAKAQESSAYEATANHILDDFTTGNEHEDIDALTEHSNTNPFTGQQQQDDTFTPPS